MPEQENKTKILIASILAGGSHNTIQELFYEKLSKNPKFEVIKFRHSKKMLDSANTRNSNYLPTLYNFGYNHIPSELAALGTMQLLKECIDVLREQQPDVLISTQNVLGFHFALAKKMLQLNTIVMTCIPDFGPPPVSTYPFNNKSVRSNNYIVFEQETKDGFINNFGLKESDIILAGYNTKEIFLETQKNDVDKKTLFREIKKLYAKEYKPEISSIKKTITISGGNGGFIRKSFNFLDTVAKGQKKNPSETGKFQYLVVCGSDTGFFKKLKKLNETKAHWKNIIPLPWLTHDLYAPLQKATDFPVLVSIGPSTMNEILTVCPNPLLIHKSRTGQEIPNRVFAVKNKLGYYIPRINELIFKIKVGFTEEELREHRLKTEEYLVSQAERFEKLDSLIENTIALNRSNSITQEEKQKQIRENSVKVGLALVPVIAGLTIAGLKFMSARNHSISSAKKENRQNDEDAKQEKVEEFSLSRFLSKLIFGNK